MSRIDDLARSDKWYLSAGDGFLWAPPFPDWLHRPGFWDEAHFFQHELAPLFSVALLDGDGREIPLELAGRRWWPGRLVARWETPSGHLYEEERYVLPGGRFCSTWRRPDAEAAGGERLVAFTAQPGPEAGEVTIADARLRWSRRLEDRHGAGLDVRCSLGVMDPPAGGRGAGDPGVGGSSREDAGDGDDADGAGGDGVTPRLAARLSQPAPVRPEWRLTPFREPWEAGVAAAEDTVGGGVGPRGDLGSTGRVEGPELEGPELEAPAVDGPEEGLVHLAVERPLAGAGGSLTFAFRFVPEEVGLRPRDAGPVTGSGASDPASPAAFAEDADSAATPDAGDGSGPVAEGGDGRGEGGDAPAPSPAIVSRRRWKAAVGRYPTFSCSDEYLDRYFDYRAYGLELNGVGGGAGNVAHPAVAEGIGYFHVPIAYSAQCHALETRWASEPDRARGSVLNFLENRRADGSLHGRIYPDHLRGTNFYHASWGDAVLAVDAVHPDPDFRRRAHRGLAAYAEWLDRERDPEGSGMYDVRNHYETGQEYMSRYLAVDPDADRSGWEGGFRLKGVDATVYAYRLKRALARLAADAGRPEEADRWTAGARAVAEAIDGRMWDPEEGIYSDVDPADGSRTGVRAAVCFYPLLTDLVSPSRLSRLLEHLRAPQEFATPVPVPSTSRDDPTFSAEGEWRGRRHACPWNGRVWPMTNSHVVEGLLRQWHRGRREAGTPAASLLRSTVRMMFHDGDPARPNCYEHYNPLTGRPSEYRGVDDYQHSWVLDLLVRGAAGLDPTRDVLRVDPLPLEVERVELSGCIVRGREVQLRRRGREVRVEVDGTRHRTEVGEPLELPW